MSSRLLLLAKAAGFVLLLIATVAVLAYALFYRPYVAELRQMRQPEGEVPGPVAHVDPEVVRQVGWLSTRRNDRSGAFTRFEPAKGAGQVRICVFGSSLAYGTEVDGEHDFPSLLQDLFERRGFANVEVLNFGVEGYGFHQIYLLWEHLWQRFHCDYSLIFPGRFLPVRDTSFSYSPFTHPYQLHARFVADGEGLRLLEVEGQTHAERFARFHAFLPSWRYLRYERLAPMALRSVAGRQQEVRNPFYHTSESAREEAFTTYRRLMRRMVESGARLVFASHREDDAELARELEAPNWVAFWIEQRKSFPYLAPMGHNSPWGNASIAEQYFARLVESGPPILHALELRATGEPGGGPLGRDGAEAAGPVGSGPGEDVSESQALGPVAPPTPELAVAN
ncbi:MAG: hypothetical protein MI919_25785, partial [Holophagales bacterium]|nr:hypothetical protein [Holophagales bacterium]